MSLHDELRAAIEIADLAGVGNVSTRQLRAILARNPEPIPCTCGFGGFHEDHNPRCERNARHPEPTVSDDDPPLPGCTGDYQCPAPAHQHGCLTDTLGHCNEPEDHREYVSDDEREGVLRVLWKIDGLYGQVGDAADALLAAGYGLRRVPDVDELVEVLAGAEDSAWTATMEQAKKHKGDYDPNAAYRVQAAAVLALMKGEK